MRISEWFYNIAPLLCIFLLSSQLETFIATAPAASMLSSVFNFDTIYATHTHIHSDILLCYGDDIELRYAIRLVSFAMFTPKGE